MAVVLAMVVVNILPLISYLRMATQYLSRESSRIVTRWRESHRVAYRAFHSIYLVIFPRIRKC